MILVIDNYDSFVENIARYLRELDQETVVHRNDRITLQQIQIMRPSHIILSPGPNTPDEAGICMDIIKSFGTQIPILGVCLGYQCIGQVMGMEVSPSGTPAHGKTAEVHHNNSALFHHIPDGFKAARYHSLILEKQFIPDMIEVSAWTEDGTIMAIHHKTYPLYGVQFHPESVLTEYGHKLLENFLNAA